MTADPPAGRDCALDSLVSRRSLRTEIIPGGDNAPSGPIVFHKPCRNRLVLPEGEDASIEFGLKAGIK